MLKRPLSVAPLAVLAGLSLAIAPMAWGANGDDVFVELEPMADLSPLESPIPLQQAETVDEGIAMSDPSEMCLEDASLNAASHTIHIHAGENIFVSGESILTGTSGDRVMIAAWPYSGYVYDTVDVTLADGSTVAHSMRTGGSSLPIFTMPDADVTVTITAKPDPVPLALYATAIGDDAGAAAPTISATSGLTGQTVTVQAAEARPGYRFVGWKIYIPMLDIYGEPEGGEGDYSSYDIYPEAFASNDLKTTLTIPGTFTDWWSHDCYVAAEYEAVAQQSSSGPTTEPPASLARNGWEKVDGTWYYYTNGYPATGWSSIGGSWYLFDDRGRMLTGWQRSNGSWYYLKASGAMATGWQKAGTTWYLLDEAGRMLTGWQKAGNGWYYLGDDGAMRTGWVKSGTSWYYLKGSGAMATGWQKVGGRWYLFDGSGRMLTGWQRAGGSWYHLSSGGAMDTGWLKSGSSWYYLKPSGAMATGWQKVGSGWYYLDPSSGKMQTGWIKPGGTWYYLASSGRMLTGWQTIGGKSYHLDEASGALR